MIMTATTLLVAPSWVERNKFVVYTRSDKDNYAIVAFAELGQHIFGIAFQPNDWIWRRQN